MRLRQTQTTRVAAARAGFGTASAYRFERDPRLPTQKKVPRGRRRPDPLAAVWESEIVPLLARAPDLRAVAIFEEIRRRHSEIGDGIAPALGAAAAVGGAPVTDHRDGCGAGGAMAGLSLGIGHRSVAEGCAGHGSLRSVT
jgi:hypothetical protein